MNVRIKTEKKDTQKIILEAIERHPTTLNKETLLEKAYNIWEESE